MNKKSILKRVVENNDEVLKCIRSMRELINVQGRVIELNRKAIEKTLEDK